MELFQERLVPFIKEHFVAVLVGFAGLVFLLYGFVSFYFVNSPQDEIAFESKNAKPMDPNTQQESVEKSIIVDVSGAVNKPGVYTLPSESRVQDAIKEAGGLAGTVDQQRIAQNLNLAAPLVDGAKLYIPVLGDQPPSTSSINSGSVQGESTAMININSASLDELDTLPGIGEVTANKIIDNRPYASIEELIEKKAVGQATFEKIKGLIQVY